jgi:hypothetical protein
MLNVYKCYDDPESLTKYEENTRFFEAVKSFKRNPSQASQDDIDQLTLRINITKMIPNIAYYYARYVMKRRWEDAEPYISRQDSIAFNYAYWVVKGRWEECEQTLIDGDPYYIARYAEDVLDGRWADIGKPEAEEVLKTYPQYAAEYAMHVMKKRWKEAEPYIKQDPRLAWGEYKEHFGIE